MSEKPNNTGIHITRPRRIDLPSPEHERSFAIRYIDWTRIKRELKMMQDPTPRLHLIYSALFGISGSSALSSITISLSKGLPTWVLPLFICISIFSCVLACSIYYMDKKNRENKVSTLDKMLIDMDEIEGSI